MKKYLKSKLTKSHDNILIDEEDAIKILGKCSEEGAYTVFKNKINKVGKERLSKNSYIKEYIANEFTIRTSKKLRNIDSLIVNEDYPYSIGYIYKSIVGEKAFLIINTKPYFDREYWINEIPESEKIKAYHLMAISGATHSYFITLISNDEIYIHKLDRNEEKISEIMKKEENLFNNIQNNIAPIPSEKDGYKHLEKEDSALLMYEKESTLKYYDNLVEKIKELDKKKKIIEEAIKEEMKDYEIASMYNKTTTTKTFKII